MEEILKLYPEFNTVTGPYLRKDGRKHLCLRSTISKKKRTLSYPKALIEIHIGRCLVGNETVDHKDEDFTNNNIDNLRILSRSDNSKRSAKNRNIVYGVCPMCKSTFELSVNQINQQTRKSDDRNKAGPFCGRKCSGLYGASVGHNKIDKIGRNLVNVEYYKLSCKEK